MFDKVIYDEEEVFTLMFDTFIYAHYDEEVSTHSFTLMFDKVIYDEEEVFTLMFDTFIYAHV